MPEIKRFGSKISWLTNRIIDISKDGNSVAFLSFRNDKTNILSKIWHFREVHVNVRIAAESLIFPIRQTERKSVSAKP